MVEKSRLQRTAENLESLRRILTNGIWIAILLVVLATLGWYLARMGQGIGSPPPVASQVVKPLAPVIPWEEVDRSLAEALISARLSAERYAGAELDLWIAELMDRVDNSFLDWYFDYWTQQSLGLKSLWQYGVHYVIKEQPTAAEKLTEEIQAEFSQRVLRPQIAQRVLERIVNETAGRYIEALRLELTEIPETYTIGRAEWHRYLEDIALTAGGTEGNRQTSLTLKTLTVSGAGGVVVLAGQMQGLLGQVSGKMLAKSSGKAATAMAVKTGGKVAAKTGGKFLGTIAGIGVLVWDVWDHTALRNENRPLLRQSLQDYFQELKSVLLHDGEFGLMATFYGLESKIVSTDGRSVSR